MTHEPPTPQELVRQHASSPQSARALKAMHKRVARRLSTAHGRAAQGEQGAVYDWLRDNYYLLNKESKQAASVLEGIGDAAGFALVCEVLYVHLCLPLRPLDGGTLCDVMGRLCRETALTYSQFSLCEAALRLALLRRAADAAEAPQDPDSGAVIGYAVGGFYAVASIDFERVALLYSEVERILMQDPAGVYPDMDAPSKNRYRSLISDIAKKRGVTETVLAQRFLDRAAREEEAPHNHIGAYILSDPALTAPRRRRGAGYLFSCFALAALGAAVCGLLAESVGVAALTLLPLYEILRTPLQRLWLAGLPPAFLPRMDIARIAPDRTGTIVTVSALLEPAGGAEKLEKRLTQLYFSNQADYLSYLILADLPGAKFPHTAQDEAMIARARGAVEALNRRYGARFFLFVRARTFSKTQNAYTGFERKRGAITELVRYIQGEETSACCVVGDVGRLRRARYLLALDSDTGLEFETAPLLVAAAAHPLNQPRFSPGGRREGGYGVFVPRVQPELGSAAATPFSRVMTGCGGISGYETHTREPYQDFFGQAIFTGKGLIDIGCFYRACAGAFPPGQVLSHDILEGGALGCAFVDDVEMVDSEPSNLSSWLTRMHRWIRGDWQNIPFLCKDFRLDGKDYRYEAPRIVRFQLFDNLLRSLSPVLCLLCVLWGAFWPGAGGWALCLAGAGAAAFAPLWNALRLIVDGGVFTLSRKFFVRAMPQVFDLLAQALVFLITLPARALSAADAIARSLWRTFISRRNLLEWTTAAQGDARRVDLRHIIRRYLPAELVGCAVLLLGRWPLARLLGLLFACLMPLVALSSRRTPADTRPLSGTQELKVREYAADMLRFYLDYATPQRHFLPPDNVQFSPRRVVAERTSPTNIGFMLLSILAGRDFELIDTAQMVRLVRGCVDTLLELPKWHGNLYNWYDTRTLEVLQPAFVSTVDSGNLAGCLVALAQGVREYVGEEPSCRALAADIDRLIDACDLTPFYAPSRRLFSIGLDCATGKMSASHYDFLMSEARLMSYFALGTRQAGRRHFSALSRATSRAGGYLGPVSWTGTMFEYYMPHLLLPAYSGSLLEEALYYCLYCQKRRVRGLGLPWGISESGFYAFDNQLNYQYKAHGAQDLGVKRGLDEELVLSPYSTFLVLPFAPGDALKNLARLEAMGLYGQYGFYEAVDCTPARTGGAGYRLVRSFMAHHVGMSLVACANAALGGVMQKRFMRDPRMMSASEFLQEKLQKGVVVYEQMKQFDTNRKQERLQPMQEESAAASPSAPRAALLSNGGVCEVLTDCGAGWLKYSDIDLTLKSEDLLAGGSGVFILCEEGEELVSAAAAPLYQSTCKNESRFTENAAVYTGRTHSLRLQVECTVSSLCNASVRTVTVESLSRAARTVSLLIYFEPVLLHPEDFLAHPSFSRLFITAQRDEVLDALLFTRRMKGGGLGRSLCAGFLEDCSFEFETDKLALLSPPYGLQSLPGYSGRPFSSADGPNAVCAIRVAVPLPPEGSRTLRFALCAGEDAQQAGNALVTLRGMRGAPVKTAAPSPLLNHSPEGSLGLQALARILYARPLQGVVRAAIQQNELGQSGLWGLSISGDLPIVTLAPPVTKDYELILIWVRLLQLLRREKLECDLAVLCENEAALQAIRLKLSHEGFSELFGARGGIFLLDACAVDPAQRTLLLAVSCYLADDKLPVRESEPFSPAAVLPALPAPLPAGGFAVHGGVFLDGAFHTDRAGGQGAAPYCHVLANPAFGTLVSDRSLGFTWAVNARENKLTPWTSDAASDNRGERLVLRLNGCCYDPVDGARAVFTPGEARYVGLCGALRVTTRVRVAARGSVKWVDVELENTGEEEATAMISYYIEPVLGVNRRTARMITGSAEEKGIVLQNSYNSAVPSALYLGCDATDWRYTFNRRRFLGGDYTEPGSLPYSDPCGALIVPRVLPPKRRERVRFILAWGRDAGAAKRVALHARADGAPAPATRRGSVRIQTPQPSLDAFVNTLLPQQVFASRLWGRTGFYQCSGAYGFRDQLQDVMNMLLLSPASARIQIARCCAVQFTEGDVLHWWHALPRRGGGISGVRTRYSDDLAWLPLAIAEYCEKTGDERFLEREVYYLEAPPLSEEEHDRYFRPGRSAVRESVYQHGLRALERAYNVTERGLARIGSGDWNDGFSRVGEQGRGESVWLSLFLALVHERFAPLCARFGDTARAALLRERAQALKAAVDAHCWDGAWYTRATFDTGEVMGANANAECRIDSLPQSFAALCGMPDDARVDAALTSAMRRLVDVEGAVIKLFDPPFENSDPSPGYVQAYPRGIRENGGQYTHAAVWLALAMLHRGRTGEGLQLLNLLNPAWRSQNGALARRYVLEPYYMAADIYTNPAFYGRGGWSIYTGAAGWYFSAVVEALLGVRMRDGSLELHPRLPEDWPGAELDCRIQDTRIRVRIVRGDAGGLLLDGAPAARIPLDGGEHEALVTLPRAL